MKVLSVLGVCVLVSVASANSCNADNCLRAVIGSGIPTRHEKDDCKSYFKATVTPAVVSTITKTKTVTTTTTTDIAPSVSSIPNPFKRGIINLEARQQTAFPSNTPDYASVCSGTARYSSACSCIGAKPTTTTLPTKTTTTVTATATKTVDYNLPIFNASQWADGACSQQIGSGWPDTVLFELGKCVNVPLSASIGFVSFSAGSCKTTAADCYILYELDFDCTDGPGYPSQPFPLEGCADIANGMFAWFSGVLVCPKCTP